MKQLKLLGILAITLTLGLAGCNKGGNEGGDGTPEESQVELCEKHTWGEKVVLKKATCTEDGLTQRTCKVCGFKEEPKEVKATGHKWVDDGESRVPTCEGKGIMDTVCSVCGEMGTREIPALGHQWSTEGGTVTPAPDPSYANFYEFPCSHGCGKKCLGFKANEPTPESKETLVIGTDGGARFFGHPIGNDVELNENGDADRDNHEPIFNEDQTGDFFEYKFELTAAQAETLATCRCFCDATPAGYMNANGVDFWANKAGDEDWTRGMYIDGEHKGEEITDYRYVLYVDGVLQEFDGTACPVNSDDRAEFEMPFTFHLHSGTNTIRLSMAGGYRSTFYNFYFRTVAA